MKKNLRKTYTQIAITYSNGNFSNNLTGEHFHVEGTENKIYLSMDMSRNIKILQKDSNCHHDALDLVEDHAKLTSIQIDEETIINGLRSAHAKFPAATWELKITLSDKTFTYAESPRMIHGSLFFDIK